MPDGLADTLLSRCDAAVAPQPYPEVRRSSGKTRLRVEEEAGVLIDHPDHAKIAEQARPQRRHYPPAGSNELNLEGS